MPLGVEAHSYAPRAKPQLYLSLCIRVQVRNLVGMPLDEELANAVGQLTTALAETPSKLTPYGFNQ
eukprot:1154343-Pelagomonas_calceolata.AAC.6